LLGVREAHAGRTEEGVGQLDRVIRLAEERSEQWLLPLYNGWLGEAHLTAGDLEWARRRAQVSLGSARGQCPDGTGTRGCRLCGEWGGGGGVAEREGGETGYREALTRASDLGMRPLVAHCHLDLGRLYRGTGDQVKAQEHLTTATTMYREMGMTFWLEKAR